MVEEGAHGLAGVAVALVGQAEGVADLAEARVVAGLEAAVAEEAGVAEVTAVGGWFATTTTASAAAVFVAEPLSVTVSVAI